MTTTVDIAGLSYVADYVSPAEQADLLNSIDQQLWLNELKRRVQHYGYKYDYKKRAVESGMYLRCYLRQAV